MRRLLVALALHGCCPAAATAPVASPNPDLPGATATADTAAEVLTAEPPPVEPPPPVPIEAPLPVEPPPPPSSAGRADGAACSTAADCAGGVCEGEGCGPEEGRCASKQRMCTRDLQTYCGCDGKEFRGSGSCPNGRFKKRGLCGAPMLPTH
jgi:hypothetical protein